jgi:hypothetical protein
MTPMMLASRADGHTGTPRAKKLIRLPHQRDLACSGPAQENSFRFSEMYDLLSPSRLATRRAGSEEHRRRRAP